MAARFAVATVDNREDPAHGDVGRFLPGDALGPAQVLVATEHVPVPFRIGNAAVSYVAYIEQFFCPVGLAVLYPHPGSHLAGGKVVGAIVALAVISGGIVAMRRRCPYLLVGWLWYLGMLLPVIGLVQAGSQAMADRYTYLPQIGLGIALAWAVAQRARSRLRRSWLYGVASAILLMALLGCAWHQASYWRDTATLWSHTLDCTTANYIAHNNLGVALHERGEVNKAMDQFNKALQVKPDYGESHYNLAFVLKRQGRTAEAIAQLQAAINSDPNYFEAHKSLALAFAGQGRFAEAVEHYRAALGIHPEDAEVHNNLGNALYHLRSIDEAITHYRQALKIMPNYAEAHNNLGNALLGQGRLDEAIRHCRRAVEIKPDYAEAHNNLGVALKENGQIDEAIAQYRQALKIRPDYAGAHNNLGALLGQQGKLDEAIVHFRKALQSDPRHEGRGGTSISPCGSRCRAQRFFAVEGGG